MLLKLLKEKFLKNVLTKRRHKNNLCGKICPQSWVQNCINTDSDAANLVLHYAPML